MFSPSRFRRGVVFQLLGVASLVALLFLTGCATNVGPAVTITSPAAQSLDQGKTVSITATVANDATNAGVSWTITSGPGSLSGATISGVTYNAPASVTTTTTVVITATSVAAPTQTSTVTITLVPPPQITTATLPAGTMGVAYSQTVAMAGGVAPYTWAIVAGPAGLSLSGSTTNSVTVQGTPTTAGVNQTFTIKVTDAQGSISTSAGLTITVLPAPAITSFAPAAATITAGTSTTLTSVFSNGTGSVSGGVGAVNSGTPVTVTPAATTTYTLTVTNAAGASVTAQTTVTVIPAPAITSFAPTAATITAGTSTTLTSVFTGGTGSVNNGVGTVTSGTAVTVTPAATTTYTLTITNAAGASVTQQTTVTVVPAPTITSFTPGSATITAGSSTTLTAVFANGTGSVNSGVGAVTNNVAVNVTPAATTTYTLTVTNAAGTSVTQQATVTVVSAPTITSFTPAAATITAGNSTTLTGVFAGGTGSVNNSVGAITSGTAVTVTPAATTTYTLTVTNTAGASVTSQTTVTVVPAPVITSFTPGAASITAGTSTTLTAVFSNGTGSVNNGVGAVTSTVAVNVTPAATTTYTLTVTNAAGTAVTQQATITVVPAPAITSFAPAAATITAGTSTTLTGVFTGGTGSVNNAVGTVTSGTAVTVTPAVTTTYTLTVTNSVGTAVTQQTTVTVVAAPAITSFLPGSATIISGNSTTLTAVFTGGTGAIDHGVGAVTSGTPVNISPAATTTYTLTVTNAATTPASVTAQASVTVNTPASITSTSSATFTVGSNGTFTVITTGNPTASISRTGSLPNNVTFTDNGNGTATIGGIPAAGTAGSYPITITAHNGVGTDAMQAFTLNVVLVQAPAITSANSATYTVGVNGTFTVTTTGSPVSAITKSGTLPSNVTFTDNGNGTATIAGIPAAGTPGSYPITITANNGVNPNAQQTFTLTVIAAPVITSFTPGATTITSGNTTTLTPVFSGGTGSVNNGVGAVTSGTAVNITPAATTTYTLTVTNAANVTVTQQVTVTVVPGPVITSFTPGAATITAGTSTTLTAVFSNGNGSVNNGVGAVTNNVAVNVAPAATTTYTLTVTNAANTSVTQQVTVTVIAAPVITSFVTGATTITAGTSTTLTALFSGGTGSINNGVGVVTNNVAVNVTPAVTTTYTLTVTNTANSSVTQQVTVNVVAAPAITSFTPGSATIVAPNSTTLTAVFTGGTGSINNGVGAVTSGTPVNITPSATTTYTLTVTNAATTPASVTAQTTVTVNIVPQITSSANTTFTVGSNGTFTVTTTGSPKPQLSEVGGLPNNVTFTDNGNGTATIAGIPQAGTAGVYPITITANNGVNPNAQQSFTLNIQSSNCASNCTISGTVSGPWVQYVQVAISGGSPTTTDANGNYSFTGLAGGTYTITPSLAGYTYSPAAPAVTTTTSTTTQNFTATPALNSYSISGTVSYSGSLTGTSHVTLINVYPCTGCSEAGGTTLTTVPSAGGTLYTVRGLAAGNYIVNAEIDGQNSGAYNASNPEGGTSGTVTITNSNQSNVNFSLADRTPPSGAGLVAPTLQVVAPSSGAAFIAYKPFQNNFNEEVGTTYRIYYGTNSSSLTSFVTVAAGNSNQVAIVSGLTNTQYYFQMSALNSSGESAKLPATPYGPVTIGNSTAGANSVSGTVTYSGTISGPLYVGLYSNNGIYFVRIASPTASTPFMISGVPAGSYQIFTVLDQNADGVIDAGDVTNFVGSNGPPPFVVSGTSSGNVIALTAANATTFVTTNHTLSGATNTYGINVGVNLGAKLPVSMTLFSGPNVAVPFDMTASSNNNDFSPIFNSSTSPTVGDLYQFRVAFEDGSTQVISSSVNAVLSSFAQNLQVNTPVAGTSTVPVLNWQTPAAPPAFYTYSVNLNNTNGSQESWSYPHDGNGLPSGSTNVTYNTDGSAQPNSPLLAGESYNWSVTVKDANSNSATNLATYTVAGATSPTVTTSFNPTATDVGNLVTLNFNIQNPNAATALTGIAFTDTLTNGISVASLGSNNCGGTPTGVTSGSTSVGLSAGSLAANTTCNFSINVTAGSPGTVSNTTGAVSTTQTGTGSTSNTATLLVLAAPTLTQLSSNSGSVGSVITITGTNFGNSQSQVNGSVTVNGVSAGTASSWSTTSITVTVPAGATGTGNIVVTVLGVQTATSGASAFTVTAGPPTVSIVVPGPVIFANKNQETITIAVANDSGSDSLTPSATVGGVACSTGTCGTFGSITGTAGSGSYTMTYTPPTSVAATTTVTLTVSSSLTGSFAATTSFNIFPAGATIVTVSGVGNRVVPGTGAHNNLLAIVYNDTAGNPGAQLSLLGSGYACPSNNGGGTICGTLAIGTTTTGSTSTGSTGVPYTQTTFSYTPPTSIPNPPYDRPMILAVSNGNNTALTQQNFALSSTGQGSLFVVNTSRIDVAQASSTAVQTTLQANINGGVDGGTNRTVNWTLAANGSSCSPGCGTLATPGYTRNGTGAVMNATIVYTPPTTVPASPNNQPTITAALVDNSSISDSFSFQIVDGTCGSGHESILNGQYAYLVKGGGATVGYDVLLGSFTANGTGGITAGTLDINRTVGPTTGLTIVSAGSSYSVGSDNRGCLTLVNSSGGTATYRIALGTVSAGVATQGSLVLFNDNSGQGQRTQGVLMKQDPTAFANAALSGNFVYGDEGIDSFGGRIVIAGAGQANGAGATSNFDTDSDDNGTLDTNDTTGSGTYSIAANGRGTGAFTRNYGAGVGNITANSVTQVVSSSEILSMNTDPLSRYTPILSGEYKKQTVASFTGTEMNNSGYVFYGYSIDGGNGGDNIVLGQAQITTGSGNVTNGTVTLDQNDNGVMNPDNSGNPGPEQSASGTFTIGSNGRMTLSGVGSNPPVFYLTGPSGGFLVGTDNSGVFGQLAQQTGTPFSTSTISGQFFFGGRASTGNSSYDVGSVGFASGSPTGTITGTDDSASPATNNSGCMQSCGIGLNPNSSISGNGTTTPYAFSAYSDSSAMFTPSATGQGLFGDGNLFAYIVSPTKIIFMQIGATTTSGFGGFKPSSALSSSPAELFMGQQ